MTCPGPEVQQTKHQTYFSTEPSDLRCQQLMAAGVMLLYILPISKMSFIMPYPDSKYGQTTQEQPKHTFLHVSEEGPGVMVIITKQSTATSWFVNWVQSHMLLYQLVHKRTYLILPLVVEKHRYAHGFFCIGGLLHDLCRTFLHY